MATPMPLEITKDEWFALGVEAVEGLVASGHSFSFDEVRRRLPPPGHPNWLGQLTRLSEVRALVVPVGYTPSQTPSRKGGVVRVYAGRDRPLGWLG